VIATLTRSVFWITLAAMFVALAVVTFRARKHVNSIEHPFASELPHALIPTPVAKALTDILTVEIAGFVLAAAAAVFEALT